MIDRLTAITIGIAPVSWIILKILWVEPLTTALNITIPPLLVALPLEYISTWVVGGAFILSLYRPLALITAWRTALSQKVMILFLILIVIGIISTFLSDLPAVVLRRGGVFLMLALMILHLSLWLHIDPRRQKIALQTLALTFIVFCSLLLIGDQYFADHPEEHLLLWQSELSILWPDTWLEHIILTDFIVFDLPMMMGTIVCLYGAVRSQGPWRWIFYLGAALALTSVVATGRSGPIFQILSGTILVLFYWSGKLAHHYSIAARTVLIAIPLMLFMTILLSLNDTCALSYGHYGCDIPYRLFDFARQISWRIYFDQSFYVGWFGFGPQASIFYNIKPYYLSPPIILDSTISSLWPIGIFKPPYHPHSWLFAIVYDLGWAGLSAFILTLYALYRWLITRCHPQWALFILGGTWGGLIFTQNYIREMPTLAAMSCIAFVLPVTAKTLAKKRQPPT